MSSKQHTNKRPRRKTSPLWLMPKDAFESLVAKSTTYSEILSHFGFSNKGGNSRILKSRIILDNIDDSHIKNVSNGVKSGKKLERPIWEYLQLNGPRIGGNELKKKLFKYNIKENICEECGQEPTWNSKPLTLQIDHINGNSADNRIENLRILCPHCHSQTPTFAGRNSSLSKKQPCPDCGRSISHKSSRCNECSSKLRSKDSWRTQPRPSRHKVPHPTAEELHTLVWSKPITQLAVDLGVSDVAIHKWCRQLGVEKPPKGYFQVGVPVRKSA